MSKIKPKIKLSKFQIKVRYLGILTLMIGVFMLTLVPQQTHAESCSDLRVVFARGSGSERWHDQNYLAFKDGIETKLQTTSLSYEFIDLDYPAIGVGIDNIGVTARALFGAGDSYEFGDSVNAGVDALRNMIDSSECVNTKYVIGGYSQGAMVVSKSLHSLKPDRLIYAATFGDPKIYLPEGAGLNPPACQGKNLSDYRIYVPDCRAYKGLLGAYTPYEPADFTGKVGTWCNKRDIFCSSYLVVSDHVAYVSGHYYEDASKLIFSKIATTFNFKNEYTSPHDTAILIDSTGSMSGLIDQYKEEALNLARKTLDAGGRVALYDYRDLADNYTPVERCNFETCTIESFQAGLDAITVNDGGDEPESLLSASIHVMQQLDWQLGSTKSLVILTDAGYHSPDLDGTTFYDVKKLSQQIDPVNFYIITTSNNLETYQSLAEATDGAVASSVDDLSALTDTIIERYDSLPRVEEEFIDEIYDTFTPQLTITNVEIEGSNATIDYETDGTNTIVILNDAILGVTNEHSITISDVDYNVANTATLVPLSDTRRGEAMSVTLESPEGYGGMANPIDATTSTDTSSVSSVSNSSNKSNPVSSPSTGVFTEQDISDGNPILFLILSTIIFLSISVVYYLHKRSKHSFKR